MLPTAPGEKERKSCIPARKSVEGASDDEVMAVSDEVLRHKGTWTNRTRRPRITSNSRNSSIQPLHFDYSRQYGPGIKQQDEANPDSSVVFHISLEYLYSLPSRSGEYN